MSVTGGCQCGAVRFRVDGELGEASICHCRMCQKATGGFYGPYVSVKLAELVWTRGERKRFKSSNKVWRGFCEACGTPLTFEYETGPGTLGLMIGALDDPAAAPPIEQLGSEHRLPWVDALHTLPQREQDEPKIVAYLADVVSHQHPDHDT